MIDPIQASVRRPAHLALNWSASATHLGTLAFARDYIVEEPYANWNR
jgi:hypothetical protein